MADLSWGNAGPGSPKASLNISERDLNIWVLFLKSIEVDIATHAQIAIAANGRIECDFGYFLTSIWRSRMWSRLLRYPGPMYA